MAAHWFVRSICLLVVCRPVSFAAAGDWPQILGPARNGVAEGETLAEAWPEGGPDRLWKRPVGEGFAGPAVLGRRVVVFHRVGDEEIAECLDAASGEALWRRAFATDYQPTVSPDGGPRCTPVIAGGRMYLFGAAAGLHCLRLDDGEVVWSRELSRDFPLIPSYFGAGSTPLLVDGRLLVNFGARNGAGIVALDAATGETAWARHDEGASYSAPVRTDLDGRPVAVFVTRMHALTIDPSDGDLLGSMEFGRTGPTVNAASPVVVGDRVFFSAAYGVGALCARIERNGRLRELWSGPIMSSQYSTSIAVGNVLYGVDGRDDVGPTALRCLDLATGRQRWSEEGFGVATLTAAGGKLLAIHTDGRATLLAIDPSAYRPLATAELFDGETRALPALSGGRLFVRDGETLACFEVGAE